MLKKITICFVTNHYGATMNGPGTFADNFIRCAMKDERIRLLVISSGNGKARYGEELIKIRKSKFFGSTFLSAFQMSILIKKLNRKHKFDFIYFNTFRLGLFSSKLGIPFCNNINDYYFTQTPENYDSLKRKLYFNFWSKKHTQLLSLATVNFVNSKFTLNKLLENTGCDKNRFLITYKGIDFDEMEFHYSEIETKINFLFVGGDFTRKGLDIIIQAMGKVRDRGLLGKLFVIGNDKKGNEKFVSIMNELKLSQFVEFLGKRGKDEISDYHKKSHIFLLPSRREALGVSIIEAAAAGTTVIASNTGGIPEIIDSGVDGILLDEISADSLFEKIEFLYNNPSIRKEMTFSALRKVGKFSFENIYERISGFFVNYEERQVKNNSSVKRNVL